MPASLAALESALATDSLEAWLERLPDDRLRSRLRQMVTFDRRIWTQYPDSLASCLLARTFGDEAFAGLHAAWTAEVEARGRPWIRPMRGLPFPEALVAELHPASGLSFAGLDVPRFVTEDEVVVVAQRRHPSFQAPEKRRRDRLRWSWAGGGAVVEPDPQADEQAPEYPRTELDGWGPAFLVRSPGAPRIALPCPEEGSAEAKFTADGARLIVYGTHDEYAGGFVWIVDAATLAVTRKLETDSPVSEVVEGGGDTFLVATSRSGTVAWIAGRAHMVSIPSHAMCISPSGAHVATLGAGLQIWSLAELVRVGASPPEPGFPPRFDPSGDRLVWETQLLDARTGRVIAALKPELGRYLEGGPAEPSLHFGTRLLICTHGGLQLWDARTGRRRRMKEPLGFSSRYTLAYDREGGRLAALGEGDRQVAVHELPSGRCIGSVDFELKGSALAMSPDGAAIAMQQGGAVEVRTLAGELVRRCGEAGKKEAKRSWWRQSPQFSGDGRRIARYLEGDGWQIWDIASGAEERVGEAREPAADFAAPQPSDWTLEIGKLTVFTHVPSGTRIGLPVQSGWVCNPADPRFFVCGELHAELRAGGD